MSFRAPYLTKTGLRFTSHDQSEENEAYLISMENRLRAQTVRYEEFALKMEASEIRAMVGHWSFEGSVDLD